MFEVHSDSSSFTKININTSPGTTNQNCSEMFFMFYYKKNMVVLVIVVLVVLLLTIPLIFERILEVVDY